MLNRIKNSGFLKRLWETKFKIFTLSIALFLAFFVVALLYCVVTHTTLDAMWESITSAEILFAIRLSLITALISTMLCLIVAIPAAYALARYNFWGKSLINTILDMPLALPPLVAGVGLLIIFGATAFGDALAEAGIKFVFTPAGIVIAQFFVNLPFPLRVMRSSFESINPRYENVAQTLGCTNEQVFWRVALPMSKNGIIASAVITWCRGIGEFGAALMIAGATRMITETLPISLYLNMSCGDLHMAIAAATILIIISVVSIFIFEYFSRSASMF
mgnify:CR=1 FL=1